jgi:catechol 2,3-dioxygenase-like lactoylglutathione lyase family enzyme
MLSYVTLGTNDLPRACRFYDAALGALDYVRHVDGENEKGYGPKDGTIQFWINRPYDDKPATVGNGTMPAFHAPSRGAVRDFHHAALNTGGSDEGAPGLRDYGPNFYAAYVRDPDGNKLSAVCLGPA